MRAGFAKCKVDLGYGARVLVLAVAAFLYLSGQASAYTRMYRFQYCASIMAAEERLACYDNYAHELGLPPPDSSSRVSATQRREGSWTVRTEAFSPDHPATIFAFTEGKIISSPKSSPLAIPTLIARCFDRKTELYMGFGTSLPTKAGQLEHSVLYMSDPAVTPKKDKGLLALKGTPQHNTRLRGELKFGDREPVNVMVRPSHDNRALFFPNPVSFIRQMRLSSSVLFIYKQKDMVPVEILFSLEGMDEAVALLRDSCGW